jgi:phosphatidate cytidylyltransferase
MTRVLSALVLLFVVIGTIWFLPPVGTLLLALVASLLAFGEYRTMATTLGVSIHAGTGATAVMLTCLAMGMGGRAGEVTVDGRFLLEPNTVYLVLGGALLVVGAIAVGTSVPGPGVLSGVAATVFPAVYIGLPLGALAAVRTDVSTHASRVHLAVEPPDGRIVVLLLIAVIVVSDSAQYYTGRALGRHPLSPAISPKKTVEGAIGGVVFGTLAMTAGGHYVFASPTWILTLVGAALSLLGIVGDLFESLLKRSAGVKDSSNLIPGHGGVLDRIDSWLFAAPVYYVFVRFIA